MNCQACNTKLEYVSGAQAPSTQFDNALELNIALLVEFSGGYGQFIDPFMDPSPRIIICHECAHKLCEENKWLKQLLQPYFSHSHTLMYKHNNPHHWGWDYDKGNTDE